MKNRLFIYYFFSGILLNNGGYYICTATELPLFMDSTGSILAGVILGPLPGFITGFTSNLIFGVMDNPINIPFSLVNATTGLLSGIISKRFGFLDAKILFLCIICVSFASALTGSILAVYLFGGITGLRLDIYIIALTEMGYWLIFSSLIIRLIVNLADKGICSVIVFLVIRMLDPEHRVAAGISYEN